MTKIEWTDESWNPTRGCSRVSEGCRNCYAERLAARNLPSSRSPITGEAFAIINGSGPHWTGKVELIESKLTEPLHWKKPRRVFVNSMSDPFHEALSDASIFHVFDVMERCPRHTFQILTKREKRMLDFMNFYAGINPEQPTLKILPNVWLGVSVEDQANKDRIDILRQTPAALRFLSIEPLLEDIGTLDLTGIHWVIIGGESGPGARPFDIQWARDTIRQCKAAGVPVFVKQLGAKPVQNAPGCLPTRPVGIWDSKGGNWEEWNVDLRIREFPR